MALINTKYKHNADLIESLGDSLVFTPKAMIKRPYILESIKTSSLSRQSSKNSKLTNVHLDP